MDDSKTWLEEFSHAAKTENIELKTELINSHTHRLCYTRICERKEH